MSESGESQSRPPIGGRCEVLLAGGSWEPAKIEAYGREHVLFTDMRGNERVEYLHSFRFRPARTEEDWAVEEMLRSLSISTRTDAVSLVCRTLYRAGYRKQ